MTASGESSVNTYGPRDGYLITAALAAFAFAQPLYDLLGQNPAFLTAHYAQPVDIALIVLSISIAVPLGLIGIQAAASLFGRRCWLVAHGAIVIALVACITLSSLAKTEGWSDTLLIAAALVLGVIFFLLLQRFSTLQSIASIAAIGVVIFPLVFLARPEVNAFAFPEKNPLNLPQVSATAPVVVLVLDELPTVSLLDEKRQIDEARFPNFARLANNAWWFRNATTVSDDTVSGAVPAIVTGIYPDDPKRYRESSRSLFTLLGGSYGMNVFETYTRICPSALCPARELPGERIRLLFSDLKVVIAHILAPPELRKSLPDISRGWKNFAQQRLSGNERRTQRLDKLWDSRKDWLETFIDSFEQTEQPQLYFLHVLLPHLPWVFLPNGNQYELEAKGLYGVPGVTKERWGDNVWAVQQAQQRHLLQLGYVDTLLGQMLNRLESLGLYDEALIVITADHGVSFRTNDARRPLTNTNAADIMRVPLIVKAPGQRQGQVSDAPVESVDVLPTVADMLGISMVWEIDGRPALDEQVANRQERRVYQQNRRSKAAANRLPIAGFNALDDGLQKKLSLFGTGGINTTQYSLGPHARLVGAALLDYATAPSKAEAPHYTLAPHASGQGAPWAVAGLLHQEGSTLSPQDLALAVSGTICSVTRSYINNPHQAAFVAFVGPQCNLDVAGDLRILEITDTNAGIVLSSLRRHDSD